MNSSGHNRTDTKMKSEDMEIDSTALIGKKRDRSEGDDALNDESEVKRIKENTVHKSAIVESSILSTAATDLTSGSQSIEISQTQQLQTHASDLKKPSYVGHIGNNGGMSIGKDLPSPLELKVKAQGERASMITKNNALLHRPPLSDSKDSKPQDNNGNGSKRKSHDLNMEKDIVMPVSLSTGDLTEDDDTIAGRKDDTRIHQKSPPIATIISFLFMFIVNIATTYILLDILISPLPVDTFSPRHHPHIIPPSEATYASRKRRRLKTNIHENDMLSNVTLRQFLSHSDGFHLGLAPSFFGFYVYFGALTAFYEAVEVEEGKTLLPVGLAADGDNIDEESEDAPEVLLRSVAGASAGAMAAVLLAAGLNPRESADFASSMTVDKFWDFPGFGGTIKGDLFEEIMVGRLKNSTLATSLKRSGSVQLEDGLVPVAVTGYDIFALKGKILTKGCMGKAARASATFPGLFQPCRWTDDGSTYLIDGGVTDVHGLVGLGHLLIDKKDKRVINMVAGTYGKRAPPGPSRLPEGIDAKEVVSISIEGAPLCGPWAMENGPRAVEAARKAIIDILDAYMWKGNEEGHYVIHVDASSFAPN